MVDPIIWDAKTLGSFTPLCTSTKFAIAPERHGYSALQPGVQFLPRNEPVYSQKLDHGACLRLQLCEIAYEYKCGYEALLTGAERREGVAHFVLARLDHQVLNHVDIARTYGLEYRGIVSNERLADTVRAPPSGNVIINVVLF